MDDLWGFDLTTAQWRQLNPPEPHPAPRFLAMMPTASGNVKAFLFGGATTLNYTTSLGDVWELTTLSSKDGLWRPLSIANPTTGIFDASAVMYKSIGPAAGGKFGNDSTLLVYGGRTTVVDVTEGYLLRVVVGCNAGTFSTDFATEPCMSCAAGTYQTDPSVSLPQCTLGCTGSTTTRGAGIWTSIDNCTECTADACNSHGDCRVLPDQNGVMCTCSFWYMHSHRCEEATTMIIIFTVVGGFLAIVGIMFVAQLIRSRIGKVQMYASLQERLLDETKIELETMQRVWDLDSRDIELKHLIGHGSFGEVWYAEWGEVPVAVKKLHAVLSNYEERFVEDFQREVKLLRALRHRHIGMDRAYSGSAAMLLFNAH